MIITHAVIILAVTLWGYESCPTLRGQHKLVVSENRMLTRILRGSIQQRNKRNGIMSSFRNLYSKLCTYYYDHQVKEDEINGDATSKYRDEHKCI
jgi:hypothetical protein